MSNQSARYNEEHNKLMKIINFRFPHKYKKIGLFGAIATFAFLIIYKFAGGDLLLMKDVCRTVMLAFLLVASLSKDSFEDEYVAHIRAQSFVVAFVCAVSYSIGLPLVALVMNFLIVKVTGDGSVNFHEVSAFEVMFMLTCFQLLFFETMKRFGHAQ